MKKWWVFLLLCACGPSKEATTLAQAAAIHSEITEAGHRTSVGVAELKRMEATLNASQQDSLTVIIQDLSGWFESLVEVPEYEHNDHGHNHDHDHSAHEINYLEGMSADEILTIQLELKKEIDWIQGRTIILLNTALSRDSIP